MIYIKIKIKDITIKGIKGLDKGISGMEKFKDKTVEIKDRTNEITNKDINDSNEYATNYIGNISKETTQNVIYNFNNYGKKSVLNTKNNIKKIKNIRTENRTKKEINEIEKVTKKVIESSKNMRKSTEKVSKGTLRASKRMIEKTKRITKVTYHSIKAIIKTIKTIIESTKALIDLLLAGGWIAVIIIIVICIIGALCNSIYGIFFSNEASDNNITMNSVIMEINNELSAKIEEEKKNKEYDEVSINSNISNWKEVFALYSVLNSSKNEDSITIDDKKKEELKKIFWQFNSIKSYIKEENRDASIVKVLYIEINSKDITNMENLYKLSYEEREEVAELLSEDYSSMWQSLIIGSVNELGWIFPVKDVYVITTYYSEIHQAIDIASNYNTNIYAITSGTVIISKGGCIVGDIICNGKAGNYIVISHDDGEYYSKYMHLNKINVKEGDKVNIGDIIGTMGNTGNVIPLPTRDNPLNGTHLHFVIEKESSSGRYPIDPNLFYCY